MSDKIHLKNRLFGGHRLHNKGFLSYTEGLFIILRNASKGFESPLLKPFLKTGFILSDLSFNCINRRIESIVEGLVHLLAAVKSPAA